MTDAVSVADARAYLRIDGGAEDALLARLIAAASGVCEGFLGAALLVREVTEEMPAPVWWRRLSQRPVRSVTGVEERVGDAWVALPVGAYAVDIDGARDGLVRVTAPGCQRIRVTYQAGLAANAGEVPPAIAQGIVRLVAHMHTHRDDDDAGPPAAVAALWRPFRRVRL